LRWFFSRKKLADTVIRHQEDLAWTYVFLDVWLNLHAKMSVCHPRREVVTELTCWDDDARLTYRISAAQCFVTFGERRKQNCVLLLDAHLKQGGNTLRSLLKSRYFVEVWSSRGCSQMNCAQESGSWLNSVDRAILTHRRCDGQ